jgi:hypothetical protein
MFNHERDYSEENGFPRIAKGSIREKNSNQRKIKKNLDHPWVVPRISARLLRERKQFGVCTRGAVFCDNRGNLRMANACRCRRIARIFPRVGVSVEVDRLPLKTMGIARRRQLIPVNASLGLKIRQQSRYSQRVEDNAFHLNFFSNPKISTASSPRLACWPCAKKFSSSK